MFGIGFWEFVLILIVMLLVLGPERIGPIMKTMGKVMREIQKGAAELRQVLKIDDEVGRIDDIKRKIVSDMLSDEEQARQPGEKKPAAGEDGGAAGEKPAQAAAAPAGPDWDRLHEDADPDVQVVTPPPDDKDKRGNG